MYEEEFVPVKLAYIDSGNSSIQIGETEFNYLEAMMLETAEGLLQSRIIQPPPSPYVHRSNADDAKYARKQLYSTSTCDELAEYLGDLSFYI